MTLGSTCDSTQIHMHTRTEPSHAAKWHARVLPACGITHRPWKAGFSGWIIAIFMIFAHFTVYIRFRGDGRKRQQGREAAKQANKLINSPRDNVAESMRVAV